MLLQQVYWSEGDGSDPCASSAEVSQDDRESLVAGEPDMVNHGEIARQSIVRNIFLIETSLRGMQVSSSHGWTSSIMCAKTGPHSTGTGER